LLDRPLNFEKRYGTGSWVVVTGATGSIGGAFCKEFAKHNFNLVMMGRNPEKLEAKSKELKNSYPTIMSKLIVSLDQKCHE